MEYVVPLSLQVSCEVVLQRNEFTVHEKENCPQRIVECKHCRNNFKSCKLTNHLNECPKMEVSCKLECGKRLFRENMAQHLKQECGLVVETCKLGCGVKLTRDELKVHEKEKCPQRIVKCKHCRRDFKSCELPRHIGECPKMSIPCPLCNVVMYREAITPHIKKNCPEERIKCLFAKYKCEVIIKRKNLGQHLDEKRTEHLELKLNSMELKLTAMEEYIIKQNKTIENLNETITGRFANFEKELTTLKTGVKYDECTRNPTKPVSYPYQTQTHVTRTIQQQGRVTTTQQPKKEMNK